MQENGIPVTYAYISDAHDNHVLVRASGPGEADYKQQLADYDTAFAAFFQRLQKRRHRQEQHALRRHRRRGRPLRRRRRHAAVRRFARLLAHAVRAADDDVPGEPDRRDHDEPEGAAPGRSSPRSTCTSTTHRRST